MYKVQFVLSFLWWCSIFGNQMAAELDQKTKYLASFGQFSPSNLVLQKGEPIALPWEGDATLKPPTNLEMYSGKGEKSDFNMPS